MNDTTSIRHLIKLSVLAAAALLHVACTTTGVGSSLRIHDAPFEPLSSSTLSDTPSQIEVTAPADSSSQEATVDVAATSSAPLPSSLRVTAGAEDTSVTTPTERTTEETMCLSPVDLRIRAAADDAFWETLECAQTNHFLGAQIGLGASVLTVAALMLFGRLGGEKVGMAPALIGLVTIPTVSIGTGLAALMGVASSKRCKRLRALAGLPRIPSAMEARSIQIQMNKRVLTEYDAQRGTDAREIRRMARVKRELDGLLADEVMLSREPGAQTCIPVTHVDPKKDELERLQSKEILSPREARRLERLLRQEATKDKASH